MLERPRVSETQQDASCTAVKYETLLLKNLSNEETCGLRTNGYSLVYKETKQVIKSDNISNRRDGIQMRSQECAKYGYERDAEVDSRHGLDACAAGVSESCLKYPKDTGEIYP